MSPAKLKVATRRHPEFIDCFEKVDSGCWEWRGHVDSNGYGKGFDSMLPDKRYGWAHRLSYRHFKGEIPLRHEIDHICQNTVCVNPEHLEAVTKVEHVRRTWERLGADRKHLSVAYLRQAKLTYTEIAEVMGYADRGGAHGAVQAALKKGLIDPEDCPPARRLSADEKLDIQDLADWGFSHQTIAEMYEIDGSHVSRVVNGKTRSQLKQGRAA